MRYDAPLTFKVKKSIFVAVSEVQMQDKTKNLLFGKYSLRLVGEVFLINARDVAEKYDVSIHTWRSYSVNRRIMPDELLLQIEDDIVKEFKKHIAKSKKPSK